jgi:hypothetical protein
VPRVLRFDNVLPNYGPFGFFLNIEYNSEQFLLCATPPTFHKEFLPNFHDFWPGCTCANPGYSMVNDGRRAGGWRVSGEKCS